MRHHLAILGLALTWAACSDSNPIQRSFIKAELPAGDATALNPDDQIAQTELEENSKRNDELYEKLGDRINTSIVDGVAITEGQIRPRRRHENDMDFSKYNPFYWQGRQSKFKVEDASQTADRQIKFTLTTEWPQNYIPTRGPDFSAIYIGDPSAESETTRSKFALNIRMKHVSDFRNFEVTLNKNDLNAYASRFKKGEILTFEFRFFMDESFADWQKQKKQDAHNISAYYSEFFRIRIGEPGLFLDNPSAPNVIASAMRNSGGWMTIPTVRVEPWKALQQQALNLSHDNSQNFMTGRTWFHTDFQNGQHVRDLSDDKPTVFFDDVKEERSGYAATAYNVHSCNSCHVNNGSSLLPEQGLAVDHTVVKTFDKTTGLNHKTLGGQLQTQGSDAEGVLKVAQYESKVVTLDDGSTVTLKKPVFKIDSKLDLANVGLSPRRPLAMIGMGLLEAIPEATIKDLAKKSGGTVQTIDGKIGRFGWKADKTSIRAQISAALKNDMGVTSKNFVEIDCGNGCTPGKGDVPDEAIDNMETYLALLGVPPRFNPEDAEVLKGEAIFDRLSCASCHVKSLKTGPSEKFPEVANQSIQAFTDLALHDMGAELSDESPLAGKSLWRTAPLWGMKNVKHSSDDHLKEFAAGNIGILWTDSHKVANKNRMQFLHDGRAETLQEAILWHGGAASASVKAYKALSKAERESLDAYLWDL